MMVHLSNIIQALNKSNLIIIDNENPVNISNERKIKQYNNNNDDNIFLSVINDYKPLNNRFYFDSHEHFLPVLLFFLMIVISIITICGNLIVILCFIKYKSLRTFSNYYILSLSSADLLIGIICMPFYAHITLNNGNWILGNVFCRIWLVFDYVAGTASVLQIVVISLDRCISVIYPIKYRNWSSRKVILINIFLVWLIAFLNYGPAIILWPLLTQTHHNASYLNDYYYDYNETIYSEHSVVNNKTINFFNSDNYYNITKLNISNSYECRADFRDNFFFLLVTACIEFFIPFISVSIINFFIYWNIRKRILRSVLIYTKIPASNILLDTKKSKHNKDINSITIDCNNEKSNNKNNSSSNNNNNNSSSNSNKNRKITRFETLEEDEEIIEGIDRDYFDEINDINNNRAEGKSNIYGNYD